MSLASVLARLDAWLKTNRSEYAAVLAPPALDADVAAAETRLGAALPDDVRALYAWHDGQSNSGWSLIGMYWLMPLSELESQRRANAKDFDGDEDLWSEAWFPVLDDGQGNLICVERESGRLLHHFNDIPDRDTVAPSLEAFFAAIVEGLEKGELILGQNEHQGVEPKDEEAWAKRRAEHGVEYPLAYAAD